VWSCLEGREFHNTKGKINIKEDNKTYVVHCKEYKHDVYIGRPSKWGNPYSHKKGTKAKFIVKTRKEAIDKYEEYLLNNKELMDQLHTLKGKTLGCFCKPKSCHGDVLIKYINKLDIKTVSIF
jgi:hypothetical protein